MAQTYARIFLLFVESQTVVSWKEICRPVDIIREGELPVSNASKDTNPQWECPAHG